MANQSNKMENSVRKEEFELMKNELNNKVFK